MNAWPRVSFGDLTRLERRPVEVIVDRHYQEIGTYSYGRGIFHKQPRSGLEVGNKDLFLMKEGDLILQVTFAWEGAIALCSKAEDGLYGSVRYPTFRVNEERCFAPFLAKYLCTRQGLEQIGRICPGSAGRNRVLAIKRLSEVMIPLPHIDEQRRIVARIDALAEKTRQVEAHLDATERDADHLLALRFRDAIADALLRPMAEVAPLVRREVTIDPNTNYTELGVRSFYKGTFQRRTVRGTEFSWQDLYRVKMDDLVFSNIMAWEQAIAIAKPEDDNCVGNHRMLTCEAKAGCAVPGFLWYYFTTADGFEKVYAASPGTVARNRTMTASSLMAIEVPIPPLNTQQSFNRLQAEVAALKARHASIRAANSALLPATLERVFL